MAYAILVKVGRSASPSAGEAEVACLQGEDGRLRVGRRGGQLRQLQILLHCSQRRPGGAAAAAARPWSAPRAPDDGLAHQYRCLPPRLQLALDVGGGGGLAGCLAEVPPEEGDV
eukprot:CAMPEP_0176311548 /NCGR_PEP_ID=MMETSP0121_2-20121125/66200_1 /TAXON_ID=160619 /ORGANISM="Kryptoperidinium foliaceum, Strain CCMP 1326" /LENGTH=113 /DNA_ID=CAMNT_0017653583 /DNA_START=89 /DNA_END=426 /DNA_ORIENTATION=+